MKRVNPENWMQAIGFRDERLTTNAELISQNAEPGLSFWILSF
jgi:hypothetical protein